MYTKLADKTYQFKNEKGERLDPIQNINFGIEIKHNKAKLVTHGSFEEVYAWHKEKMQKEETNIKFIMICTDNNVENINKIMNDNDELNSYLKNISVINLKG